MFLQDNVTIFVIIINKMKNKKKRWKIESNFQLVLLFIVFAITGSTSCYQSRYVCG
jgi:hypothetical protein